MRAWTRLLAVLALGTALASPLVADTRKDNIDVIIALDKSLSMENKVNAVKDWVNSFIIDQLLIPGDYFVVIAFYGKADVIISQQLKSDADKQALKSIISQVRGNGRYTDIGNALDNVKAEVAARESDKREKYVLLLTDGIQEAPPTSKYFSKDGKFNHEFLANTKTIQEKGWKVMILGIGTETAAKDLAHELQGSYNEIPSNPTATQLTQTAGNLFGDVAVQGSVSVSPVAPDGSSRLSFTLQSSGLASDATITLSGVDARTGTRDLGNVLPSPFTFTVRKAGTTSVQVPLKFPAELPADAGATALAFSFSSGLHFAPSSVTISLHPATWVQTNLLLLIVAVAALLVIVAVVLILLWRFTRGRPVRFTVLIEDEPVSPEASTLSGGKELFLNETDGEFALVVRRNARSVARFAVKDGKLSLGVLKQDRFPKLKEPPAEARGKTFVMKSENGRNLSLKVQSEERKK